MLPLAIGWVLIFEASNVMLLQKHLWEALAELTKRLQFLNSVPRKNDTILNKMEDMASLLQVCCDSRHAHAARREPIIIAGPSLRRFAQTSHKPSTKMDSITRLRAGELLDVLTTHDSGFSIETSIPCFIHSRLQSLIATEQTIQRAVKFVDFRLACIPTRRAINRIADALRAGTSNSEMRVRSRRTKSYPNSRGRALVKMPTLERTCWSSSSLFTQSFLPKSRRRSESA